MRSNQLLLGVTLGLLLAPAALPSQVFQVGEPFRLDLTGGESQLPDVATGGDGNFVVVWRESPGGAVAGVSGRRVEVAADGITAQPAGGEFVVEAPQPETDVTRPAVAMDDAGRFVVVWGEGRISESCVEGHRFNPLAVSLGRIVVDACSPFPRQPQTSVAITPDGRFAIAWDERTGAGADQQAVFLRLFAESAQPSGGPVRVSESASAANPSVALDFLGRPAVAWERGFQPFLRLFQATGQPRGGETPLRFVGRGPQVAADATGKLVTAVGDGWLAVQLYTAAGLPYERPFFNETQEPAADWVGNPDVAADSLGNFVVVWEEDWVDGLGLPELERPQILGRVFNNRGAPQSHDFIFSPGPGGAYTSPAVALREDGTFLITWESRPPGGPSRILGQLVTLRENDNVCIYRDQEFRCATLLNSSSFFNQAVSFGRGLAAGDRPFLADVDGDGDDDPCVRRGGAFLCDTAQDGGDPEVILPFGGAAHVPLLGDLDGDGDDDPCVRRGRTFLCDTAHDGGEAEVKILFGLASDLPVLGDADRDGDDDPCVLRVNAGIFLCDIDHDGQRDLIQGVAGVEPGDRPLMGDRGFCVARGPRLLCAIDEHGFREEGAGRRNDYPLLGNIDGF